MSNHDAISKLPEEKQRAMLRALLQQRVRHGGGTEPVERFPMSLQQQSLWYEFQRDPDWPGFNMFLPARVRSPIDVDRFRQAMTELVRRHASLRTTFGSRQGEPVQQIHRSLEPGFQVLDVAHLDAEAIQQQVLAESVKPFDLQHGPLVRLTLFRRASDDWVVMATAHHIVVDFWSLVILLSEIGQLYRDLVGCGQNRLTPAANNYHLFVHQQRELLGSERSQPLRRYWRKQLRGTSRVTEFPTDFVRPLSFTGRASSLPISFSEKTVRRMFDLASSLGVTLPSVLLAIIQVLVHRYTGQRSFLIGSPFAGRIQRDFEDTVGFFVNMLPLRAEISDEWTFEDLIRNASKTFADAMEHEALPLSEIIRECGAPHDASRSPLFQVSCTFEKSHRRDQEGRAGYLFTQALQRANVGGLVQESYSVPIQTCHYDLEFMFERFEGGLHALLCYCRDLFDRSSVERLVENLCELANQLVRHPSRPLQDVSWTRKADWNRPRPPTGGAATSAATLRGDTSKEATQPASDHDRSPLLIHAIRGMAQSNPDRIALQSPQFQQTYGQLLEEIDRIAANLHRRGIGAGSFVPVFGARGPEVISALLGVIASGAAVVPIDVSEPAVAPEVLLRDTAATLVILAEESQRSVVEAGPERAVEIRTVKQLLEESQDRLLRPPEPRSSDLCYLIYTSGSAGRPKGVIVEHGAIDNTMRWRSETIPLGGDDRILMLLSHQFDAGFGMMMSALIQGARIVWMREASANVDAIVETLAKESITILPTIPSLLSLIIDHPELARGNRVRQVWTGGESMPSDLPERVRRRLGVSFWNFYGPTEAAVEATAADVTGHDKNRIVPIGFPVRDTEILVLDPQLRRLPPTVPGELGIRGPGLARGYLGQTDQTARRFPTLADGHRVYLTGDRGRELADGSFEFLGRYDHQVKVGGYRIEIPEIEQTLVACPFVKEAAVSVHSVDDATSGLIAYVAVDADEDADHATIVTNIRQFIADRLPPFKRPKQIMLLPTLPKTPSGKVDRRRLPEPTWQQVAQQEYVAPRTPLEQFLAGQWAKTLGIETVGIFDDFFELGGSSLQAAALASRLSEQLNVPVPTSLVFEMPSVNRVGERLALLHPEEMTQRFGVDSVSAHGRFENHRGAFGAARSLHPLIAAWGPEWNGEDAGSIGPMLRKTPVFMIHPPGGIVVCYRDLARRLRGRLPFYAIRSRGLHGVETLPDSVQEMASQYVEAIESTCPTGPYQLGGWSLGGIVAWEVARQLLQRGKEIERIVLLDTAIPRQEGNRGDTATETSAMETSATEVDAGAEYGLDFTLEELAQLPPDQQLPLLWEHAKNLGVLDDDTPRDVVEKTLNELKHLFHHHVQLISKYELPAQPIPVLLIRPREVPIPIAPTDDRGWSAFSPKVTVALVAGHHHSMVKPPGVHEIAELI